MSLLYINENGAVIGIDGCRCTIKYADGMKRSLPIESLEAITIMGKSQMTTQCTEECLKEESLFTFQKAESTLDDFNLQDILMWQDRENKVLCMIQNFP